MTDKMKVWLCFAVGVLVGSIVPHDLILHAQFMSEQGAAPSRVLHIYIAFMLCAGIVWSGYWTLYKRGVTRIVVAGFFGFMLSEAIGLVVFWLTR